MTEVKHKNIKDSLFLFFAQILSFAIITVNYRAIAQADYFWSILSDIIIVTISYFVLRKIIETKSSILQWIFYVIGGAIGTFIGIFISIILLKT